MRLQSAGTDLSITRDSCLPAGTNISIIRDTMNQSHPSLLDIQRKPPIPTLRDIDRETKARPQQMKCVKLRPSRNKIQEARDGLRIVARYFSDRWEFPLRRVRDYHKISCCCNRRFKPSLVKSSSSGICSISPVRFANRSPWFRYARMAGTAAGSNSISS